MGFGLSPMEMMIVGVVAILLFGQRLPDVAKSLGASYRQFRQGLSEFHSHVDITGTFNSSASNSSKYSPRVETRDPDDYEEATAPRFEPPPSEPVASSGSQGDSAESKST